MYFQTKKLNLVTKNYTFSFLAENDIEKVPKKQKSVI